MVRFRVTATSAALVLAGTAAEALAGPGAGAAQGGEVAAVGEILVVSFPARPGVCGAGDAVLIREPGGATSVVSGSWWSGPERWHDGDPPCTTGPVVVRIERVGEEVVRVGLSVGPAPADDGAVLHTDGQTGADLLLDHVHRATDRAARTLVLAAALAADATTWPALLRLARDPALASGTRSAAIHWLGRQAAAEAGDGLSALARDATEEDRIRDAAVFALSRLPGGRGVPLLIDLVRTSDDPRVRARALFWLAGSGDDRALEVFEEILSGR